MSCCWPPRCRGSVARASVEHGPAKLAAPPLSWFEIDTPSAPTAFAPHPNVRLQPLEVQPLDVELARDVDVPAMRDAPAPEYVRRMAVLTARIQGLWKLPHTRLAADFRCRARLRPGESGAARRGELESCDDSGPVRASIAQAIEHAMPLPLPQKRSRDCRGHRAAIRRLRQPERRRPYLHRAGRQLKFSAVVRNFIHQSTIVHITRRRWRRHLGGP